MTEYFNRSSEKELRRSLRSNMPAPEVRLWTRLRGQQMGGAKFRRQYSIGPFVLDFYCTSLRLAIEVDGETHYAEGAQNRDARRTEYLRRFGVRVLRFTNPEVMQNLEGVLEVIWGEIERRRLELQPPSIPPS